MSKAAKYNPADEAKPGHLENGYLNFPNDPARAKRSKRSGMATAAIKKLPAPALNWSAPTK
jgi:hypothetical protein